MAEQFTYDFKTALLVSPTTEVEGFSRTISLKNWARCVVAVQVTGAFQPSGGGGLSIWDWPEAAPEQSVIAANASQAMALADEQGQLPLPESGAGIKFADVYRSGLSSTFLRLAWILEPGASLTAWAIRIGPDTSVDPGPTPIGKKAILLELDPE
jgi:hypothetical protein